MDPYQPYTPDELARLRSLSFSPPLAEETDPGELDEWRGLRDRAMHELYLQSRTSGIQVPARGGLLIVGVSSDLCTLKAVDFAAGQVVGTALTFGAAQGLLLCLEEGRDFDLQRYEPGRDTRLTVSPLGIVFLHAAAPEIIPEYSAAGLHEATYTFRDVTLAVSLPHLLAAARMLVGGLL